MTSAVQPTILEYLSDPREGLKRMPERRYYVDDPRIRFAGLVLISLLLI